MKKIEYYVQLYLCHPTKHNIVKRWLKKTKKLAILEFVEGLNNHRPDALQTTMKLLRGW